jgi:hypothetical protein
VVKKNHLTTKDTKGITKGTKEEIFRFKLVSFYTFFGS